MSGGSVMNIPRKRADDFESQLVSVIANIAVENAHTVILLWDINLDNLSVRRH